MQSQLDNLILPAIPSSVLDMRRYTVAVLPMVERLDAGASIDRAIHEVHDRRLVKMMVEGRQVVCACDKLPIYTKYVRSRDRV